MRIERKVFSVCYELKLLVLVRSEVRRQGYIFKSIGLVMNNSLSARNDFFLE